MAVREWLQLKEPIFYGDGIFKIMVLLILLLFST